MVWLSTITACPTSFSSESTDDYCAQEKFCSGLVHTQSTVSTDIKFIISARRQLNADGIASVPRVTTRCGEGENCELRDEWYPLSTQVKMSLSVTKEEVVDTILNIVTMETFLKQ